MSEEPTDTEILDWLSKQRNVTWSGSPGVRGELVIDGLKVQMGKHIREAAIKAMEAESASLVNELLIPTFQKAIQATYGCPSDLRERVRFREEFQEELVWEGEVLIFDLIGHPTALTCYAWSVDSRVTAVLHEGPVDSPQAAVRAAIVEE